MSARPWRGTLIYAGTVAGVAAVAVARFAGGAAVEPTASGPTSDGASAGTSSGGSSGGSSDARGSGTGRSSARAAEGPTSSPTSTPTQDAAPDPSGSVTVVGAVVQVHWGPVQVAVTFTGDRITSVQALQSPDEREHSVEINAQALPILAEEAVAAGSADIDTVSGATFTSEGYRESLQSAIDQRG
ncbi:FMN-binding protein [Cellulomonas sp. HZM]|uniref:FMN-binding protein n=1 Tax=Cellulomonas sp. HZM TaxID=1454010 RepID=UPI000493A76C|nr:FMN-binding protein [Cellulomonas sp. HZM]